MLPLLIVIGMLGIELAACTSHSNIENAPTRSGTFRVATR